MCVSVAQDRLVKATEDSSPTVCECVLAARGRTLSTPRTPPVWWCTPNTLIVETSTYPSHIEEKTVFRHEVRYHGMYHGAWCFVIVTVVCSGGPRHSDESERISTP